MTRGRAGVLAAALLLTACSSVVTGHGTAPSGRSTADFPARYARTPRVTAVGDVVTANFCAAIGLSSLEQAGYAAAITAQQIMPGCYLDVAVPGSARKALLSLYPTPVQPAAPKGHTTRDVAGLTITQDPLDPATGDCERDVPVEGFDGQVHVDLPPRGSFRPTAPVVCTLADIVASDLALALAHHALPRLPLASPSILRYEACAVVRASGLLDRPLLAGAHPQYDEFDAGCRVVASRVWFSVEALRLAAPVPEHATPVVAGGHHLYRGTDDGPTQCSVYSVQGHAADGRYEAVFGFLQPAPGVRTLPAGACDQARGALVDYLDTAGLP